MGYYIETGALRKGKTGYIADTYGAIIIRKPKTFEEIPSGMALIVVVENEHFDAAAFVYDKEEFERIHYSEDYRTKHYLLMNREKAEELTKFKLRRGA